MSQKRNSNFLDIILLGPKMTHIRQPQTEVLHKRTDARVAENQAVKELQCLKITRPQMKLTKLALIAALALAGTALFQSTNAATVPFPTDGDLFMGFHSTSANEYLVDIGQFSLFNNQPIGFHLSLGNFGADLTAALGSNWFSDISAQWGVAGTLDATSQLFASKLRAPGGATQPWVRQSTASQTNSGSTIDTMVFGDYAGQEATANNPRGVIHSTGGLSWASYNNGANSNGSSFGTWVPTIEGPQIPGLPGNSIPSSQLDLFRLDPNNAGGTLFGQYIGTFSIDASGNVSYDVIPEPSTYACLVAGFVFLLVLLRFRSRSLKA